MEPVASVRIDKWLWAVRVYKTRSLATTACRAGNVKVNDQRVKPSHTVKPDEIIVARNGEIVRTVKVVAMLEKRVAAKEVPTFMTDLTPPEELSPRRSPKAAPVLVRERGTGRPTKRDRRKIDELME